MGMFFNSWKDDDAEYYYGSISETGSSNYNRGYSDGYSAGKKYLSKCEIKKYDDDIDKRKPQYISNELDFGDSDELGYSGDESDDCLSISEGPTYTLD